MPELPEVETVRRGLEPVLEGATITHVDVNRNGLRFPFPENLAKMLIGRQILSVQRRAKYILIELDNNKTLVSHLGMSGSWRIEPDVNIDHISEIKQPAHKHDHVVLYIDRPDSVEIPVNITNQKLKTIRISYNDPRRFGYILLIENEHLKKHSLFAKIGIEPLGNSLNGPFIQHAFQGKKTVLKTILLNQNIIAGLGNIYVCEALWRAQLSPWRPAQDLAKNSQKARNEAEQLSTAIKSVLQDALASGGSHLRNYVQADGSLGYFQHYFAVYGKEGSQCPRCGHNILRETISGRSTFYCAHCQK